MSQHFSHCRTWPGGISLAFARRHLLVLGLVYPFETLRIYDMQLPLASMPSCACEIHVLCQKNFPVAYLGVRALCCLKVVVTGCWLCRFGPRLAIELPQGFPVASQALLGLFYPFGPVGRSSEPF